MYAAALLFTATTACAGSNSDVATLHQLTDYVDTFGARSIDGSPYEMWVSLASPSSPNADRWVLDIMGGAWCQSIGACAERAYNPTNCFLGSSNASCFNADSERCQNKTTAMQFSCLPACNGARWCGGLFTNSSQTNPLTSDWNKVLLPYKDGQSFSGNLNDPVMTTYRGNTVPLYFRGQRNFLASIDYLTKNLGMDKAVEVGLTGNSAGGLATFYHADTLTSLMPNAKVWAAPDSGFFFANETSYPAWKAGLLGMVAMANSTLNTNCVAAMTASGSDPNTCAFPEVLAPYIQTPLFVMNSRYDPALDSISAGEGGSNVPHVNSIGRQFLSDLASTVKSGKKNAGFITACHEHCGQWAQGSDGDFNTTINGVQAIPALMQWRKALINNQDPYALWVQAPGDTYPCANCCSGGSGVVGGQEQLLRGR